MGYGIAYFRWRTLILQKFGPAYFDTEWGAYALWQVQQQRDQEVVVVNL